METTDLYNLIISHGFSTDTRALAPGQIFIALRGENFDGNDMATTALLAGAAYAVIDKPSCKLNDAYILVHNTLETLQHVANIHRKQFSIPIIAIGGSNGKTTTKELVQAVLSKKYTTHATTGNLNNDIGVPLTLLTMPKDTEIAVIEIGANHPLEHTTLMDIISPTYVLITNNGADHLEGFGSLEGVRSANKEIYESARKQNGKVFVNRHIPDLCEDSEGLDRIMYPTKPVHGTSSLYAGVNYDGADITTSLFGSYNEPNILAAITVGEYFDVPLSDIKEAIQNYTPTLKRSQIINRPDYSVILDCYNANPSSMKLALEDFAKGSTGGKRFFIIGDMLEMGDEEARLHKEILDLVQTLTDPEDVVWCVGPRFGAYSKEYPFTFFEHAVDAKGPFSDINLIGKTIFLKASRGIKLEDVIKEKIPL